MSEQSLNELHAIIKDLSSLKVEDSARLAVKCQQYVAQVLCDAITLAGNQSRLLPVVLAQHEIENIHMLINLWPVDEAPYFVLRALQSYTLLNDLAELQLFLSQRLIVLFQHDYIGDHGEYAEIYEAFCDAVFTDESLTDYVSGIVQECGQGSGRRMIMKISEKVPRNHRSLVAHAQVMLQALIDYEAAHDVDFLDACDPIVFIEPSDRVRFYVETDFRGNESLVQMQKFGNCLIDFK